MSCKYKLKSGKLCGNKSPRFVILDKNEKDYKIALSCEYHFAKAYNVPMEKKKK